MQTFSRPLPLARLISLPGGMLLNLDHVALIIPVRDAEKLQKKIRVAAASGYSGLFRAFCGFGQLAPRTHIAD